MSAASSLPRTPVLVVDDERDVRELVTFALERAGYEVVAANDGVDALDKISGGFEPLVIVLDLEMPRLDGEGLIRELAERAAPVPHVIVFTAHPFRRPKSATMCIEKPCAPSRLVGAVSMVLASPYGEEP